MARATHKARSTQKGDFHMKTHALSWRSIAGGIAATAVIFGPAACGGTYDPNAENGESEVSEQSQALTSCTVGCYTEYYSSCRDVIDMGYLTCRGFSSHGYTKTCVPHSTGGCFDTSECNGSTVSCAWHAACPSGLAKGQSCALACQCTSGVCTSGVCQ
jgi:hypothetical protein